MRFKKLDGSAPEIYAKGIRNTVGFDWRPNDELNHAPKSGMHFGFPYCHEGIITDPEFSNPPCSKF